ncbi:MAG: SPASM domain-containing protein [Candidatus Aureabacteria bacterium]|nr:SPASM domain-containing protein [Candidatus Auribacterota bacterium]
MIKYVKKKRSDIKIIISTNLNISDTSILSDIMDSGGDEIIISCDGATEETYLKYRAGGDFGMVMQNMQFMADYKRRFQMNTDLIWKFLVFKHNENELEKAKASADKIGVQFRPGLMRISMQDEIFKPRSESIQKDRDWIPDNPLYSAYDKENNVTKKTFKTCRKPWQEISINWEGKVFPCCAVYEDQYNFGNAQEEPVKDIWNNRMFDLARREILYRKQSVSTVCGICRNNGFMHI